MLSSKIRNRAIMSDSKDSSLLFNIILEILASAPGTNK